MGAATIVTDSELETVGSDSRIVARIFTMFFRILICSPWFTMITHLNPIFQAQNEAHAISKEILVTLDEQNHLLIAM